MFIQARRSSSVPHLVPQKKQRSLAPYINILQQLLYTGVGLTSPGDGGVLVSDVSPWSPAARVICGGTASSPPPEGFGILRPSDRLLSAFYGQEAHNPFRGSGLSGRMQQQLLGGPVESL